MRYVTATPTATVLLLSVELVRTLAGSNREFARSIEVLSAQRLRTLLDRLGANLSHSAMARVAKTIFPYAVPEDGLVDALAPLPALTHAEIALSAGTVKEVVSRALGKLEDAGASVRRGVAAAEEEL